MKTVKYKFTNYSEEKVDNVLEVRILEPNLIFLIGEKFQKYIATHTLQYLEVYDND